MLYSIYSFPKPTIPPMQNIADLIPAAFTIAIVAFAVSVSMAKIFAKKHNYEIDSNQVSNINLIAYV